MTTTPLERAARAATVAFGKATNGTMYLKDGTNLVIAQAVIDAIGPSWQPIKELPDRHEYLVDLWWDAGPGERFRIPDCSYRDPISWITDSGTMIPREYITHWMPLPDPPEGT